MADALMEALRSGKVHPVQAALKADPQLARHPRYIVEAGRLAFQAAMELLQRHGADLNASWKRYRPLHALLQERPHAHAAPTPERLACLDWMLQNGCDPEQLGAWPPARGIITAAFVGEWEYVTRLRKLRKRIDGFAGAALGDVQAIRQTLGANPEFVHQRDGETLTALQCACGSRLPDVDLLEVARLLVDAGADVRARTRSWGHDLDAAYYAAGSPDPRLFELLLDRGADPTEALVSAVWGKHYDLAEMALRHGAQPDCAIHEGHPLLNQLVRWGQVPQTLWLVAHGASPNVPDADGWTAVHQAASRGNERMMQALLDAGGDAKKRDRVKWTPLDVASDRKRDKLHVLMMAAVRG